MALINLHKHKYAIFGVLLLSKMRCINFQNGLIEFEIPLSLNDKR